MTFYRTLVSQAGQQVTRRVFVGDATQIKKISLIRLCYQKRLSSTSQIQSSLTMARVKKARILGHVTYHRNSRPSGQQHITDFFFSSMPTRFCQCMIPLRNFVSIFQLLMSRLLVSQGGPLATGRVLVAVAT
jgi:hypothetical protein